MLIFHQGLLPLSSSAFINSLPAHCFPYMPLPFIHLSVCSSANPCIQLHDILLAAKQQDLSPRPMPTLVKIDYQICQVFSQLLRLGQKSNVVFHYFPSQAIKACHTLKVFHLHRSGVDDEKVRVLISHVLDHPSLLTLGLWNSLNQSLFSYECLT